MDNTYIEQLNETGSESLFYKGLFTQTLLTEIWNCPRKAEVDTRQREPSIFRINNNLMSQKLENLILPLLFGANSSDYSLCNSLSILHLSQPTKPHVDGPFPYATMKEKKYSIIKSCVVLMAIDTEYDTHKVSSDFVTFNEHLLYLKGGLESDFLHSQDKKHSDLVMYNYKGDIIKYSDKYFTEDRDSYPHIFYEYDGQMAKGLSIEKIHTMQLGDMVVMNPYQFHCTKKYINFNEKYVFRFGIYKKIE